MTDANARIVKTRSLDPDDFEGVAPHGAEHENWSGRQLRSFVNEHRLVCLNTYRNDAAGPTYSDARGHLTRVDYILLPVDMLTSVLSKRVRYKQGYLIQRATTALRWIDHAPLELWLRYRDWHSNDVAQGQRWDKEALRLASRDPTIPTRFVRELDTWASSEETLDALEATVRAREIDMAWNL
eukprot:6631591-Heterocapsa_arctica.AAC.1